LEFTSVAGALVLEPVVALVLVVALVVLVLVLVLVVVLVLVRVGVVADCEPHAPSVAASPTASPAAAIREPRRCQRAAGDRPRRNTAGSVAASAPAVVVSQVASRDRRAA
jgi:hypothetical protein